MDKKKNSLLALAIVCLTGCHGQQEQQELANALAGSWQGEHEGQQWCLTLMPSGTSTVGEGAADYRATYKRDEKLETIYSAGVWLVGIGGRLQVNLNPSPLDENFNPLPPKDIQTASARFLVKTLEEDRLAYLEYKPDDSFGDTFHSRRVDSCDTFFKRTK